MMGGRRPASGAGSYFNASSNPRVAATGRIIGLTLYGIKNLTKNEEAKMSKLIRLALVKVGCPPDLCEWNESDSGEVEFLIRFPKNYRYFGPRFSKLIRPTLWRNENAMYGFICQQFCLNRPPRIPEGIKHNKARVSLPCEVSPHSRNHWVLHAMLLPRWTHSYDTPGHVPASPSSDRRHRLVNIAEPMRRFK